LELREFANFGLTEKVIVCHKLITTTNYRWYTKYINRSGPKVTKSSCDWKIVAEKSWKFVKTIVLIRVDGAALNDIITATKGITVFPPLCLNL
jgi:hypothetical protein